MSTKKYLRAAPGQRIDEPDFTFATQRGPLAADSASMIPIVGEEAFVIAGFEPSGAGSVVTITRDDAGGPGSAILALRGPDGLQWGHVTPGGRATHSIDMAGQPDGTYTIYIAATLRDSDFANRAAWNPDAGTGGPIEVTTYGATRKSLEWSAIIVPETAAPGEEWLAIGRLVISGSGTSYTVTDRRPLFFEGNPGSFVPYWQDAEAQYPNFRDNDRARYGARSLRTVIRALQSQIGLLIADVGSGLGVPWWNSPVSGDANGSGPRSVTQLNAEKLARNGSQTMDGDLDPGTSGAYDLGNNGARWRTLSAESANFSDLVAADSLVSNSLDTVDGQIVDLTVLGAHPDASIDDARVYADMLPIARVHVAFSAGPAPVLTNAHGISGAVMTDSDFSVTFTFASPLVDSDYVVLISRFGTAPRLYSFAVPTATTFKIYKQDTTHSSVAFTTGDSFDIVVIGGRVA